MNNNLGFKIKKLRESKNISQENLAVQLDISQSYLSKIENGAIEKVDFFFMQKVCDYFQVTPQYFFDDYIIQNNFNNSYNSAVGNIYSTVTINNNIDENLFKNLIYNHEQITNLVKVQNELIEKLFTK